LVPLWETLIYLELRFLVEVIMAEELSDDEQILLTIIASQARIIFSLDWLVKKTDGTREDVEEKLLSLEEKGYIRLKRIQDAIPTSDLTTQNKLLRVASSTLKTMEQIEQLWKKRKQAKRSIYKKLRSELLENLDVYMSQLDEAIIDVEKQLEKLDSQIKGMQEKIYEIKLGSEIDYIESGEAKKLLDSYDKERKDLLEKRNMLIMFIKPSASEYQRRVLEAERDSLKYEVEVLNTKRLIGAIDEEEYQKKVAKLDEETTKIKRTIEDHAGFNIEEALRRLEKMRNTKAIPKKIRERVFKQFNRILLLK
jgi:hypothetical protein